MRRQSMFLAMTLASATVVAPRAVAAQPDEPTPAPTPASEAAPPSATEAEVARLREAVEAQRRAQAELEARVARQESAVKLSAYAHIDWTIFRQSSQNEVDPAGEPLNENRFTLRRGRVSVESDRGLVHALLALDANTIRGPQVRPWNAEISLKWPAAKPYTGPSELAVVTQDELFVMVTAGLLITPFGADVAELERSRAFLERSIMAGALFPQSYDLGVRIVGGYKVVNWALGIMNGDPIGEKTFPGRDPHESKDLVFRLGTSVPVHEHVRVAAGISGLTGTGFHKGSPGTKDQLVWRDQNEDTVVQPTELQTIPGAPATPSSGFQRFAMGADVRVEVDVPVLGTLALRGELVRAKNLDRGLVVADPVVASRDLRELGWYVAGTQEITRWVMAGVRYDVYNPDSDALVQRPFALVPKDASFATWSFMATVRYQKLRLIAEYDLRRNSVGRNSAGTPTTLADDAFTLRAAVGF